MKVHVLMGRFESSDDARRYAEAQWEPEPPSDTPDEVYAAWEARNPVWALRSDLGIYLDSDFIEIVDHTQDEPYLEKHLKNPADLDRVRGIAPADANILVLIFEAALGGFRSKLGSTPRLTHCGEYDWEP